MRDDEDREFDSKLQLVPSKDSGKARRPVSLDVLKSAYIAEGLNADEISSRYALPLEKVKEIIEKNSLTELRKAYVREGISKLQNKQVDQAKRLMDIEVNFKKLRIEQLEDKLKDYVAYYERHGDFYKRHPVSGEILRDTNGIPMQINIPTVSKEITHLKESVTLSEGMKQVIRQLDDIINTERPKENIKEDDMILEAEFSEIFEDSDSE